MEPDPDLGHQPDKYAQYEGGQEFDFDIVGESFYQDALTAICGGKARGGHEFECVAYLVPEPDNPHDENAVAVYIHGLKVGHIPKKLAKRFAEVLGGRKMTVDAVIVGGWKTKRGDEGHFGVKLDL